MLLLAACEVERLPVEEPVVAPRGPMPASEAQPAVLRRLTAEQYENAIHDLFGEGVVLTGSLEPDEPADGLVALGVGVNTISPRGVEQYEESAFTIAEQVVSDPALRDAHFPCADPGDIDVSCLRETFPGFLHRAWRRPATDEELDRLYWLALEAGGKLGSHWEGLTYALAAILQSPYFLYRVESGAEGAYADEEMASRLSFFLWNTIPDDELLRAAGAGELTTDAGLAAQVDRLLADDRAREGTRAFFTDMLRLDELDELSKDTTIFLHMDETVGPSAREETLSTLDWLVWQEPGDWRDIFTTRTTFLNRKLAALYNVRAPAREGFGETELEGEARIGLLGQASVLALHAHPTSTSVTRRGLFVREVLLCQDLPDPPANVDTSIPASTTDAPTMRDRVQQHLSDPACASCHTQTDPIGLALENFDGLGGWRANDGGAEIDPSGELDGAAFSDASGLAQAVHDHPALGPCLARTVYEYANGHSVATDEAQLVAWHGFGFRESGYDVRALLRDVALSPGFRRVP